MTWGSVTELCYKTWVCSLGCSLWIIESMATNERMFSLEGVILFLLSLFILIWSRISWILHYRTPIVFPWVCLFNHLLTVLSELRHFELFFASFELSFFNLFFPLNTRVFIEIIYLHLCSVWIKDSNGDKEKKILGRRKLFNLFIFYRFNSIIFRLVIPYNCFHFHIYPLSYLSFFHVLFRLLTRSTNAWLEHNWWNIILNYNKPVGDMLQF